MKKIAPSILSADFTRLKDDIESVALADYIHYDVMDGVFVPNISVGIPVLQSIRKVFPETVLDAHLMITEPIRYAERFCDAGADIVTVHLEADSEDKIVEAMKQIRAKGKKAGISIKPATPAEALKPYLALADLILIMTVEPGFGGQGFMYDQVDKIREVRKMIDESGYEIELEVDGGINDETAVICSEAGAEVLVSGSYLFKKADRAAEIKRLKEML